MLRIMKPMAKAVVSPLVDSTGWYDRRLRRASESPGAWTIVMYHRVIDDPAADPFHLGMCVMRDRFEAQIRYFSRRFQILTVGDAARRLASGQALPERALSITFDDGYRDNLTLALPVMKSLGVPFSIYVPTQGMEDNRMLWWDRVIAAMACTRKKQLDLAQVGLASSSERVPLGGLSAKPHVERVLNRLWDLGNVQCERSVDLIERQLAPATTRQLMANRLRPQEVQRLHLEGAEMGAHSVSHPNLELAGEELIRHELEGSRNVLQSLLQAPVTGFAYPGGRVGSVAMRLISELGFAYALGTEPGVNLPPYALTRLLRIGMPDSALPDFRRAVSRTMTKMATHEQNHP